MELNEKDESRLYGYTASSRTDQTFTDEQIKDALRAAASEKDGALTRASYQRYYETNEGKPHPYTIIRRYSKWSLGLQAAGLSSNRRTTYQGKISQEDCVRGLLFARQRIGHLPSVGEYNSLWHQVMKAQGMPSEATIRLKFGKWREACAAAAKELDGQPEVNKVKSRTK